MGFIKRLKTSGSVSLEAFKMYYIRDACVRVIPTWRVYRLSDIDSVHFMICIHYLVLTISTCARAAICYYTLYSF